MNLKEFEIEFKKLGINPKADVVDRFNKGLIKNKIDVAFLKPIIESHEEYYRTYFQVSINLAKTIDEKFKFIEDNFYLLHDWWHVDGLMVYLGDCIDFDYTYKKAKQYVKSKLPYVRRFGYVVFIPRLVKDKRNMEKLLALLKNDDEYHVIMGEAWLLSFLAMCDSEKTYNYMKNCDLKYNIIGKAIQKICDSYVISDKTKQHFKQLREHRKQIK